jgi:hypothetical protein
MGFHKPSSGCGKAFQRVEYLVMQEAGTQKAIDGTLVFVFLITFSIPYVS